MRSAELEDHCKIVAQALESGKMIAFLGAGVNLANRPKGRVWEKDGRYLPSGSELAEHLAERFGYPVRTRPCADPRCPDPKLTQRSPDLLQVSQYAAVTNGTGPLYHELHQLFGSDHYGPTLPHRFLARLARRLTDLREQARGDGSKEEPSQLLILTTNYDDALEQALGDQPFDLVWYQADPERNSDSRRRFWYQAYGNEARPIHLPNKESAPFDDRPVIVKLHGAIDRDRRRDESFVITEDHYIEYLTLPKLLPVGLMTRLKNSHFLFLGYSLSDWNMRVILHRIWEGQRLSWRSWAVQKGPSAVDERLWGERGVELLDVHLATYVKALAKPLGLSLKK